MERLLDGLMKSWEVNLSLKGVCRYRISMKNDFVTRLGEIAKHQVLDADIVRRCKGYSSVDRLYLEAEYEEACFYEGRRTRAPELRSLTFPVGEVVGHYKLLPNENIQAFRDQYAYVDAVKEQSVPFSRFPATPIVNLLQLQCYDIIALEELHSQVIKNQNRLSRIGDRISILLDNAAAIELQFKGAVGGESNFRMFELEIECAGISVHRTCPVLVYKYESRGALKVSKRASAAREINMGESYFCGEIYVDISDGDLERATMCEFLTMSRVSGSSGPVPIHRRRKVDYHRI